MTIFANLGLNENGETNKETTTRTTQPEITISTSNTTITVSLQLETTIETSTNTHLTTTKIPETTVTQSPTKSTASQTQKFQSYPNNRFKLPAFSDLTEN